MAARHQQAAAKICRHVHSSSAASWAAAAVPAAGSAVEAEHPVPYCNRVGGVVYQKAMDRCITSAVAA
jgi:hypothetical protein